MQSKMQGTRTTTQRDDLSLAAVSKLGSDSLECVYVAHFGWGRETFRGDLFAVEHGSQRKKSAE